MIREPTTVTGLAFLLCGTSCARRSPSNEKVPEVIAAFAMEFWVLGCRVPEQCISTYLKGTIQLISLRCRRCPSISTDDHGDACKGFDVHSDRALPFHDGSKGMKKIGYV